MVLQETLCDFSNAASFQRPSITGVLFDSPLQRLVHEDETASSLRERATEQLHENAREVLAVDEAGSTGSELHQLHEVFTVEKALHE